MAKPRELPWHDLPTYAKRKVLQLLSAESEKHPQGHYGAAVRAAMVRLPESPQGKLPPRRTEKGKLLADMIRIPQTREQAFQKIVDAVVKKRCILKGAAHLGVHKWTLFQYMKLYPKLGARVRAANPAANKRRDPAVVRRERRSFAAER